MAFRNNLGGTPAHALAFNAEVNSKPPGWYIVDMRSKPPNFLCGPYSTGFVAYDVWRAMMISDKYLNCNLDMVKAPTRELQRLLYNQRAG